MIDDDFHLYDTTLPIITMQSELNNYCNTMRALGSLLDTHFTDLGMPARNQLHRHWFLTQHAQGPLSRTITSLSGVGNR